MKTKIVILALFATIGLMAQTKIKYRQLENPATSSVNLQQGANIGGVLSWTNTSAGGYWNRMYVRDWNNSGLDLPALYFGIKDPTLYNYALACDSTTTVFNGVYNMHLRAQNKTFMNVAVSSGSTIATIQFPATSQATVGTTEVRKITISGNTVGWPTGNVLATQREFQISAPTYSANGSATITTAITLDVTKPTQGTNMTLTNPLAARFTGNVNITTGRILLNQGTDVASVAGAITLGTGNVFEITGTNAITLISNLEWKNGSEVTLLFTSTATLTDGTANSGTDIGMELAGNVDFVGTAGDVVTLVLSEIGGTQRWREKCRSVN